MQFGVGSIAAGFLAGLLSILSPCVLPLLPLVLVPAAAERRSGMLAVVTGLLTAFVGTGLLMAAVGFSVGLGDTLFRDAAAALLACAGVLLASRSVERRFALAAGRLSSAAGTLAGEIAGSGWGGQFVVGVLLGAVWSPCVGPTLGAASLLAAQTRDLPLVASVMIAFGFGAAVSLLALGTLSREALIGWRGRLVVAGRTGKLILGMSLLTVAALVLTGADRWLEGTLVAISPAWLTNLTTRF